MLTKSNGTSFDMARVQPAVSRQVSRLIAAAIINQGFRELLLRDASLAISRGFNGETFDLDEDSLRMVISIRARTLSEFAREIAAYCQTPAVPRAAQSYPNGSHNGKSNLRQEARSI